MDRPILEMKQIEKSFSGVKVLKSVDFTVYPGEVHGLMGENGAGKSTLIKILTGIYPKDGGQIFINGKEVSIDSRNDSRKLGISVIYQELSVISSLTVAQNVFLGQEESKGPFLSEKEMNKKVAELIDRYKFDLKPTDLVQSLSIAKRQTVEILKALLSDAEIIIMDEPTASITQKESQTLFEIIDRLRKQGKSIIYISHRLDEVEMIVDRLTVLRDGSVVGIREKGGINKGEIIRLMIGKELHNEQTVYHAPQGDKNLLEVNNLSIGGVLHHCSFKAYGGQILGIGGLVGSGRTEILKSIFGLQPYDAGEIILNGKRVSRSARKNARSGIGLVPEDRRTEGFIPLMSLERNIILAAYDRFSMGNLFVKVKQAKSAALKEIDNVDVRPKIPELNAINLSGGNQQKIVLGKWLIRDDLRVLLVDEPTVGIDVGAKDQIYSIMRGIADAGGIVVMVSSDLRELTTVSDRILIMVKGSVFKVLDNVGVTQEDVLTASYGIEKEAQGQ